MHWLLFLGFSCRCLLFVKADAVLCYARGRSQLSPEVVATGLIDLSSCQPLSYFLWRASRVFICSFVLFLCIDRNLYLLLVHLGRPVSLCFSNIISALYCVWVAAFSTNRFHLFVCVWIAASSTDFIYLFVAFLFPTVTIAGCNFGHSWYSKREEKNEEK